MDILNFSLFCLLSLLRLSQSFASATETNTSSSQWVEGTLVGSSGNEKSYRRECWSKKNCDKDIMTGSVSPDCMRYLEQFSNATAKFINCTVANARPLHYCENCVSEYMSVNNVYKIIFNNEGKNESSNCKRQILRADNVQVVLATYNFILYIWDKSKCDQCFDVTESNDTQIYKPAESTKKLLAMIENTLSCFSDFGQGVVPGLVTQDPNQTVCSFCVKLYCEANDYYETVEKENKLCSDLIDSMNYTRLDWGQKFKCSVAQKDQGEIWEIAALVFSLPILLYVGVWVHANQDFLLGHCGVIRHTRLDNAE
uniref:Osteopetrosis-associated transmembrane protein 1-like n=1 Tax=Phallusia mammillata TaxID=59560 RepID=A0A6F9DME2_9ASCI|nr:osteopetrosis-associated transmembrane protein 1-like [Phallusia mammillata]